MADPYAALREEIFRTVLDGPGETPPALRHAVADNAGVPEELRALVDKVHHHAYRVTDDDVARLQPTYGDDRLFEIVVAATVGAARARLLAGLAALEQA